MTDLFFDPPWYLPVAIAALGIYLFVFGNRRQEGKVRNAGLGVLLVAVALFLMGRFIDTDREKAEKGTRALIASVESHDWTRMASLLDAKANVATPRGAVYGNREMIVGGAQAATEQYGVKNIRVTSLQSRQDSSGVVMVDLDVWSDQGLTGTPFPTSWQMEWHELPDGWKLMRVVCLKIGQETGEGLDGRFPRPK
jgi:hypothetical protein